MTAASATFDLPPVMKLEDCQELHTFLQQSIDESVTLNCAEVTRVGGMAGQIMQMAANTWAANNLSFTLSATTEECVSSLTTLGLGALLTQEGLD